MSLFTETVNRVAELEAELAAEKERCRNLEIMFKAERTAKLRALGWPSEDAPNARAQRNYNPLNSVSAEDTEKQMAQIEAERDFKMVITYPDSEEIDDSFRTRFFSPALKFCALFRSGK
jgi:hypothetical protein